MRLGIAHHFGWAVAVMASADYKVVDRRRIELIEPGVPTAPIHHEGGPHLLHRSTEPLDDNALAALVAEVRASVVRATSAALDESRPRRPNRSSRCRFERGRPTFPRTSPSNVAFRTRAEPTPSCIAKCWPSWHATRGWAVHLYNAKDVENKAVRILGGRADEVLHGPRAKLGPPWSKDHRMALAATIVVSRSRP